MLNELNELKRKKKEIKAAFREGRHASQASYRLAETEVEYNSWAAEVALLEAQIKQSTVEEAAKESESRICGIYKL